MSEDLQNIGLRDNWQIKTPDNLAPDPNTCHDCGDQISHDQIYCDECGEKPIQCKL